MTNAAYYAAATEIRIRLRTASRRGCDGALVSVEDDGRGFNPAARPGSAHGLMGMRYRVEAEGGEMHLESAPGRGTRIEAWLPVKAAPQQDLPVLVDAGSPA